MRLSSISSFLLVAVGYVQAAPAASPETVGANGECPPPEIQVFSNEKVKQGPYLVAGARSDAGPHGGVASFGNSWSVTNTLQYGGGLDIAQAFASIAKEATATLGFEFSYSTSKTTAFNTITACAPNDLYNYTITWGLQDWRYSWHITGQMTFGGHDPLARCSGDRVKFAGQTVPYDVYVPAVQEGASSNAGAEIQFGCCTDSRGPTYPDYAVCPDAS
ncbi:MAG: hypothetical protein Q9222_002829 [Ikaeria aurantiellina]